jgi:D-xylonolactonase
MTASTKAPRVLDGPHCVWPAEATLGEGTCWSVREQALWWVDILGHRLHRLTPASGERRSWDFDATISAVAERARGPGLFVTLQRSFALFDPATGAVTRLQQPEPELPKNRFNDGKCDAAGRFWAGTMDFDCVAPSGSLYRYAATGAGANALARGADAASGGAVGPEATHAASPDRFGRWVRALDAGFAVTNGPTWSQDGRTLYFTETTRGRIHAFDFDLASGTLSNRRLWLQFEKGEGHPDGMTTDAAGRIWIAHWGGARVTCRDPASGAELARIALPTDHITNVAFGGAAFDTLYITSATSGLDAARRRAQPLAGGLFAARTDAIGVPANLFAG